MSTNVEKLHQKLTDSGLSLVSVFPGSGNPTAEDVAGEILRVLESIERDGLKALEELPDETFDKMDNNAWLATACLVADDINKELKKINSNLEDILESGSKED